MLLGKNCGWHMDCFRQQNIFPIDDGAVEGHDERESVVDELLKNLAESSTL